MFLQTSVVLVSKSTCKSPLLSISSPRGWQCLWSIMCPAFPQPASVAFFQLSRGFVSTASYSELGQLSDARWPNSARPSLNSLRKGNTGKAVPLHCSCSRASSTALLRRDCSYCRLWSSCTVNNLLVSGLQSNYFRRAAFWVTFLYCILPQTCFFCMW